MAARAGVFMVAETWSRSHGASLGLVLLALISAGCPNKKTGGGTDRPDGGTGPNVNPGGIVATGNYQAVWPGANYGPTDGFMRHVVAAKDVAFKESIEIGNLDVITTFPAERANGAGEDQMVKTLYKGNDAVLDSVRISEGVPERALFIATPGSGVVAGELYMADLSQWPPVVKAVTGKSGPAVNVPVGGYFFGKGSHMLFVEQIPATGGTGQLDWTDVANAKTTNIAAGALPSTVLVSADRAHAVAAAGLVLPGSANSGRGDLYAINMTTGRNVSVETGIDALANTYAQTGCTGQEAASNPDCALRSAGDRAFTLSDDGKVVAYAKNGEVFVATLDYTGEAPSVGVRKSLGAGRFPGVSRSGARVAFFDGSGNLQVLDITNANSPSPVVNTISAGFLCPRFSPDDQYVLFLEKLSVKGNNPQFGSDLGTLRLMKAASGATPVTYAEHVLWHSLAFWPNDTGRATVQLSVMSNSHDPFSPLTFTAGPGSVGDLLVDAPGALPTTGRTHSSPPVGQSIDPSNFALLPASGGFGILTATSVSAMATPNADVWLPASPIVRPGNTQHLAQFVLAGSLQTSASVPGLGSVDEVIVSVSNSNYTWAFDNRLARGDLWGATAGNAALLKADVFFQALSTDGRVLAIHPQSDSPDSLTTEIWSLPLQGSR